jgi:hypothetical protein
MIRTRDYVLTRWLILRLLGFVYVFAFLGIIFQGLPLLGSHGLTPAATYIDGISFWKLPTLFVFDCSDFALQAWAYAGLVLGLACLAGYANLPSLLILWLIYGSYERIGQTWWAFGWEIQLLETTLVAAFLAHPWDPRPLAARPPPTTAIVLARWLVFRIMLGAGLIKLKGAACWKDLSCLDSHFETQPIPNPLSPWFHHLPHVVHAIGVAFNHFVEVICPFFVFGPRVLRIGAGVAMIAFQIVLILSGNLAFLNWLTIIPILACFDDDFLLALTPKRWRERLRARLPQPIVRNTWQLWFAITVALALILFFEGSFALGLVVAAVPLAFLANREWRRWLLPKLGRRDVRQIAIGAFCALVIFKSWRVVDNLTSKRQDMNAAYDRLALVNTYGAFGSVGDERYELVIEGTLAEDPATADWKAYELPCKPGDLARRPCILGPYHRRLDWLIWFAAMEPCEWQLVPRENTTLFACFFTGKDGQRHAYLPEDPPWWFHLVYKLLDGDRGIRTLLAVDPFDGKKPRWIRIRRFRYRFADNSNWWARDDETMWLPPIALDTPGFSDALAGWGWPSPTLK